MKLEPRFERRVSDGKLGIISTKSARSDHHCIVRRTQGVCKNPGLGVRDPAGGSAPAGQAAVKALRPLEADKRTTEADGDGKCLYEFICPVRKEPPLDAHARFSQSCGPFPRDKRVGVLGGEDDPRYSRRDDRFRAGWGLFPGTTVAARLQRAEQSRACELSGSLEARAGVDQGGHFRVGCAGAFVEALPDDGPVTYQYGAHRGIDTGKGPGTLGKRNRPLHD
jgi:hypothetical protein